MKCGNGWIAVLAGLALAIGGCGKSAGGGKELAAESDGNARPNSETDSLARSADATAQPDSPEAATHQFLEAVRTGNDRTAEGMFTDLARERIKELKIQVAPKGSDTAKFEVAKAELLAADGARVPCKWTDIDKEGNARTDEMTWMLRKEPEGWRIAGMAAVIFENEDPLLLDFENPKETMQKLERLSEEIARRTSPPEKQARQEEKPDEYFFLETFGSAVVEHLITVAGARLCAWADVRGAGRVAADVVKRTMSWHIKRDKVPAVTAVIRTGSVAA